MYSRLLTCTAVVAFLVSAMPATAADPPKEKKYGPDAELYLLRQLEMVYAGWKTPDVGAGELGAWVHVTRNRLTDYKKSAKNHGAAAEVVDAYDDTLKLLDAYEEYLKDEVYIDLITGVARPEQKDFSACVGGGAITGALTATAATNVVLPIVGTLVGAPAGAAIGGTGGFIDWLLSRESALKKNEQLDELKRQARQKLIAQLARKFDTTYRGVKREADTLAAKHKWGESVGYDGSGKQSLAKQVELRPQDPFALAAVGVSKARGGELKTSAAAFASAAERVPEDAFSHLDLFDRDRAEFLLTASRMNELASRGSKDADTLAALAIKQYRAARDCTADGEKYFPLPARLSYARACATAGEEKEANAVIAALLVGQSKDATLLFESAGVKARLGKTADALADLKASFAAEPRWQPAAITDPRIAPLVAANRTAVSRVCANPLVGTWTDDKLTLDFYLDGRVRQKLNGAEKNGTYEQLDGEVQLVTADKNVKLAYSIENGRLKLGGKYDLAWKPPGLLGTWTHGPDTVTFRADGTWAKDGPGGATSGTFAITPPKDGTSAAVVMTRTDILLPATEKRFNFKVSGDSLTVTPTGATNEYTYQRK